MRPLGRHRFKVCLNLPRIPKGRKSAEGAKDRHHETSKGGFTLLEVMIAVAILAIALPVLLGLRNWDLELRHQARQQTMATLLAQEKLLETELMGVPPLGEQQGAFNEPPPGFPPSVDTTDRAPGFRWTRTVLPTPLSSIREVRIRVSWPRGLKQDAIEMSSYVFLQTVSPSS